ncbi:hypothetical protein BS78_06G054900 [Paspalum vaginatum]|nr:hypothetical protein BS78_06G054900 [Paspalum vaginatum]
MGIKAALLLLVVLQVLSVLVAAGRPMAVVGDGIDGVLEDGTGMLAQILGTIKSAPNPPSHCCN